MQAWPVPMKPPPDDDLIERLAVRAASGDEATWQALWRVVAPRLERTVAQPSFMARLGQREDDRLNIVVEVMARLRADGFQRLAQYAAARRDNPALRFMTWLRVVAKRVGIDYLRGHPDYIDRRREDVGVPGEWVDPATLPPPSLLPGERPPVTAHGAARKIADYAAGAMSDPQRRALALWTRGEGFPDIARALDLADDVAERLVRTGIERLRRRFRGGTS